MWKARFARFEGDVAERAEEYEVWFDGSGTAVQDGSYAPRGTAWGDPERGRGQGVGRVNNS